MLADIFSASGFTTTALTSIQDIDTLLLRRNNIDLIVLDAMLPGEEGFNICRQVRAVSAIPIILLAAVSDPVDRIVALEIGADDYITQPINSRELIARMRALLRRSRASATADPGTRPLTFAGWRLEPIARQLYNAAGARVWLTSAEFDLLLAFCRNPGCILSRQQLLELTHGGLAGPVARSVDVHISRIRRKIEPQPRDPTLIKTVRLGGYVFTPRVLPLF